MTDTVIVLEPFSKHVRSIVLCKYIFHISIEYATLSWYQIFKTDSDLDLTAIEGEIVNKRNKK